MENKSMVMGLFKPWPIRLLLAILGAIALYDVFCNQFSVPKIPEVWGMTGSLLPWWGWLLIIQTAMVIALSDYVRRGIASLGNAASVLNESTPVQFGGVNPDAIRKLEKRLTPWQDHVTRLLERMEQAESNITRLKEATDALDASHTDHNDKRATEIAELLAMHRKLDRQHIEMSELTQETALAKLAEIVVEMDRLAAAVYGGEPPFWYDRGEVQADPPTQERFSELDDLAAKVIEAGKIHGIRIPSDVGRFPFFDPLGVFGPNDYQTGNPTLMRLRLNHHLLKTITAENQPSG